MNDPIWPGFERFVLFGPAQPTPGTDAHRFPALTEWRARRCEIGSPMWAAACWEAEAKDAIAAGEFAVAREYLERARDLLVDATLPETGHGAAGAIRSVSGRRANAA